MATNTRYGNPQFGGENYPSQGSCHQNYYNNSYDYYDNYTNSDYSVDSNSDYVPSVTINNSYGHDTYANNSSYTNNSSYSNSTSYTSNSSYADNNRGYDSWSNYYNNYSNNQLESNLYGNTEVSGQSKNYNYNSYYSNTNNSYYSNTNNSYGYNYAASNNYTSNTGNPVHYHHQHDHRYAPSGDTRLAGASYKSLTNKTYLCPIVRYKYTTSPDCSSTPSPTSDRTIDTFTPSESTTFY